MTMKLTAGNIIGAASLVVASAAMSQPASPPSQGWTIGVAPAKCTASYTRLQPVPLRTAISTLPGSDAYAVGIAAADLPRFDGLYPVTLVLDGTDRRFEYKARTLPSAGDGPSSIMIRGAGSDFVDALARSASVSVVAKSKTYGPFALPKTEAAISAFRKCMGEQLIEWGADRAQFTPGGHTPVALRPRDDWISNSQLIAMAGRGPAFHALFRLTVTVDGKVDGCTFADTAKHDAAEKIGCSAVMGKRLFAPATDPQGHPVRGAAAFEVQLFSGPAVDTSRQPRAATRSSRSRIRGQPPPMPR